MPTATSSVQEYLGKDADQLLGYEAKVDKSLLHLPGPDFIDRVWKDSDRNTQALRSLQTLYSHGRLGGPGYMSILPVDQGIEHSAGASFAKNPIIKLAVSEHINHLHSQGKRHLPPHRARSPVLHQSARASNTRPVTAGVTSLLSDTYSARANQLQPPPHQTDMTEAATQPRRAITLNHEQVSFCCILFVPFALRVFCGFCSE